MQSRRAGGRLQPHSGCWGPPWPGWGLMGCWAGCVGGWVLAAVLSPLLPPASPLAGSGKSESCSACAAGAAAAPGWRWPLPRGLCRGKAEGAGGGCSLPARRWPHGGTGISQSPVHPPPLPTRVLVRGCGRAPCPHGGPRGAAGASGQGWGVQPGPGFPAASGRSCRPESPQLPRVGEEQRSVSPAPAEPWCRKTTATPAWQSPAGGTGSLVPAASALHRAGSEMQPRSPPPDLLGAAPGSAAGLGLAAAGVVRDVNEGDAVPRGPAPPGLAEPAWL